MASGPITTWQRDEGNVEKVTDFIFLGAKITVDSDYNHDIQRTKIMTSSPIISWQINGGKWKK